MTDKEFRVGDVVKEPYDERVGKIVQDVERTSLFDWKVEWENGEESDKKEHSLELIERHCKFHQMKMLYSSKCDELFCPACRNRKGRYEKTELDEFINNNGPDQ